MTGSVEEQEVLTALKKIKYAAYSTITPGMLAEVKVDVLRSIFSDNIGVRVTGALLGEDLAEYQFITYDSWWDMFREKLPFWLNRRLGPIRKHKTTITASIVYPQIHNKIAFPNEEHKLLFKEWESMCEEDDG